MTTPIYLDHAATTPLRGEARAAMEPYLCGEYANPSSVYRAAQAVRSALDAARDTVAACLGARAVEVIFTSGGTESNNAALWGTVLAAGTRGRHIVTTAIEHHAVLQPAAELADALGADVTEVPVGPDGVVDPASVERALRPDTAVISVMWVNNEIGTIQPVAEIGALARARNIPFHVDAVQAAGSIPIDLARLPVDLLSISAHKFGGPKGAGVLYVRTGTEWWPYVTGGTQERNRRGGTENVAGIIGLATALRLACEERDRTNVRVRILRDTLLAEMRARLGDVTVNGSLVERVPGNLNVSFPGVHGEALLMALDRAGIMASSGAACTSGSTEPSHVLLALGRSPQQAGSALRFTLGSENTQDEVARTVQALTEAVGRLRSAARLVGNR